MKLFNSIFLILFFFSSCGHKPSPQTTDFFGVAMTVPYKIVIGSELAKSQINDIKELVQEVFAHIDLVYNKWNPDSEVSMLNRLKAKVSYPISEELFNFFSYLEEIYELTNFYFDPTVETIQQLWKSHLEDGMLPDQHVVEKIKESIGWKSISFQNRIFQKSNDLTALDLGGIAKGYCVDLLSQKLSEKGYINHLIDWGGELKASGKHPDDRPWRVYIRSASSEKYEDAIAVIELNQQAIATSGHYNQFWEVNLQGKSHLFTHIINPQTGHPLVIDDQSVVSVSVVADSCLLADALATAAMIYPTKAESLAWLESIKLKYPSIQFWVE